MRQLREVTCCGGRLNRCRRSGRHFCTVFQNRQFQSGQSLASSATCLINWHETGHSETHIPALENSLTRIVGGCSLADGLIKGLGSERNLTTLADTLEYHSVRWAHRLRERNATMVAMERPAPIKRAQSHSTIIP